MPYIDPKRREPVRDNGAETAGELNFEFTFALTDYIERKGLTYQTINDIIGALENCKLEFYRRVVVNYENEKIIVNGDVYSS